MPQAVALEPVSLPESLESELVEEEPGAAAAALAVVVDVEAAALEDDGYGVDDALRAVVAGGAGGNGLGGEALAKLEYVVAGLATVVVERQWVTPCCGTGLAHGWAEC